MADDVSVKLHGQVQLLSSLREFQISNPIAIMNGVKRVAAMIERDAKLNCPVDTGRLRASISHNWTGSGNDTGIAKTKYTVKSKNRKGGKAKPLTNADFVGQPSNRPDSFVAVIGTNVEYAVYVEFNETANHPDGGRAHYLYNAYFKNESKVKDEIASELGKLMAKAFRK